MCIAGMVPEVSNGGRGPAPEQISSSGHGFLHHLVGP